MYTLEEARAFVPTAKGCGIAINKDAAWEGKYRMRKITPRSHSKSFEPGNAESSFASLRRVLIWLWQVHHEETSEVCLFDFGEPIG